MPTFEKTIFTNQGISFINDLNSAHSKLVSANTVYSSSDLSGMSDDDIKNMTDISNKELTANCDIIKLNDHETKIRSTANNENLKQGVYIRTYATYVVDQDGNQTLFGIKVNTKPQYLAAYDGVNTNAQSYGFNVGISQTDSVMFTKLSNLATTMQDLERLKLIGTLSDNDDILKLPESGHYTINGNNPANNPWGKDIWADVYKTDYNIVIRDNTGNEFIRSNYDSIWRQTLNTYDYEHIINSISSSTSSAVNISQSLANSAASSAQIYAQYNVIGPLSDNDDILNLKKNGHYTINGSNPKNNPWGNKPIWADVYKTEYNIVIRDNTGNEFIRSNYDSIWRQTLNNYDYEHLSNDIKGNASQAATFYNNAVKDNHDGSITFNGINLPIQGIISPNADLFSITEPGIWQSVWGNQDTLKNFPSKNGAATIVALGAGANNHFGMKLIVIDAWGAEYWSTWNNDHYNAWQQTPDSSQIQSLANNVSGLADAVKYSYIKELSNSDDILDLPQNGHYVVRGTNPANNPWGKNIWADVYKTDYQTIVRDNTGNQFVRSNFDSTWKSLLNNLDRDTLNSNAQSLADSNATNISNVATSLGNWNRSGFDQVGGSVAWLYGQNEQRTSDIASNSRAIGSVASSLGNWNRSGFDSLGGSVSWLMTQNNSRTADISNLSSSVASADSSLASAVQYSYIKELGNSDDILNLPQNGHYVVRGANPANNPWGKQIWADVYKTDYQTIVRDNTGNQFVRSNFDSTWKSLLTNVDGANLQTQINAANNNATQDNHDGSITFNGINMSLAKPINPNANLFNITSPGIWYSSWGNQTTLDNLPGGNGACVIIAYGAPNIVYKLTVINSWGYEYASYNINGTFSSWKIVSNP